MGVIIDEIIGRAVRDEAFRKELLADPVAATSSYKLTAEQITEVKSITESSLDGNSSGLDQRVSKKKM